MTRVITTTVRIGVDDERLAELIKEAQADPDTMAAAMKVFQRVTDVITLEMLGVGQAGTRLLRRAARELGT